MITESSIASPPHRIVGPNRRQTSGGGGAMSRGGVGVGPTMHFCIFFHIFVIFLPMFFEFFLSFSGKSCLFFGETFWEQLKIFWKSLQREKYACLFFCSLWSFEQCSFFPLCLCAYLYPPLHIPSRQALLSSWVVTSEA